MFIVAAYPGKNTVTVQAPVEDRKSLEEKVTSPRPCVSSKSEAQVYDRQFS